MASGDRGTIGRFVLVGISSSGAYSLIMAAIVRWTAAPVFLMSVVVFGCFVPLTFLAHRFATFRARNISRVAFPAYAMLQIACFSLIAFASAHFVTGRYFLDATLYFLTVGLAAGISFVIARNFVFRSQE